MVTRRTVSRNCTVQYCTLYQILKPQRRLRFSGVDIRENQAGTVTIEYNGRVLAHSASPLVPRQLIADRKLLQTLDAPTDHPNKARIPAKDHPWIIRAKRESSYYQIT